MKCTGEGTSHSTNLLLHYTAYKFRGVRVSLRLSLVRATVQFLLNNFTFITAYTGVCDTYLLFTIPNA